MIKHLWCNYILTIGQFFIKAQALICIFYGGNPVFAEEHMSSHLHCTGKVKLMNIVECVLDHSPEYRTARLQVGVMQGRKKTSAYLFPSNPVFSFAYAHRKQAGESSGISLGGTSSAVNGEIAVSQEIFISSQRRIRIGIAESDLSSSEKRAYVSERNTSADALSAAVRLSSADEEMEVSSELYSTAKNLYAVVQARAERGLLSAVEADLAKSELTRMTRVLQSSKRKREAARANLIVMMGAPSSAEVKIEDSLPEISLKNKGTEQLIESALNYRMEIEAAVSDVRSAERRMELLRTERIPNLNLGLYLQRDGFNENVAGARLSFPLAAVRNYSGEIEEAKHTAEQKRSSAEVARHTVRYEVMKAVSDFRSLKEEKDSYSEELLKNVESSLQSLRKAVSLGQMNLRDALITQQSLISLRLTYIQTRLEYQLAGIELLRSGGLPFFNFQE